MTNVVIHVHGADLSSPEARKRVAAELEASIKRHQSPAYRHVPALAQPPSRAFRVGSRIGYTVARIVGLVK